MTWFRVDDGFGEHPKVDALGADQGAALSVWLLCGTACARTLSDGFVTQAMLVRACASLGPATRARGVAALVRVGLWEESQNGSQNGWRFHDWHDHQPSRESVIAKRDAEKAKKRGQRVPLSPGDKSGTSPGKPAACPPGSPPGSPMGSPAPPVPTRPDPSRSSTPHIHRSGSETRAPAPARPPPSGDVLVPVVEATWAEWRRVFGRVPAAGSVQAVSAILLGRAGTPTHEERRTADRCRALMDQAPSNGEVLSWTKRAVAAFRLDDYAASSGHPFALFAARAGEFAARSAVQPNHVPDDFSDVPSIESRFGPEV